MDHEGKVAIITGAASGIGKATSRIFAAEGARVVLGDVNAVGAKDAEAELRGRGADAVAVGVELTDAEQVQALVATAVSTYGRLDVLVNAAGITHQLDTTIEDVPDDLFDRIIAVNLRSVFLTCKHAFPQMKAAGGGAIVNVASAAAVSGAGGASYTASKGAVCALTRHIAYQGARHNIRCNSVLPGPVDTPMLQISMSKVGLEAAPTMPGTIRRLAQPEEIGHLISYLASDKAAYITASQYAIDGGMTQR